MDVQVKDSYPYVVRTTKNNGIRGYILENEKYTNDANTLSFAQDTFSVFYQKEKYFTGNKVKTLKSKFKNTNEKIMIYLTASIQKSIKDFTWGIGSTVETIFETKINLPIKNGEIDFDFMETFILELEAECILELEAECILELEAYLTVTGLKDYNLTNEELRLLDMFECNLILFDNYRIEDVLQWKSQKEINPLKLEQLKDIKEKKYPFYGQSIVNNGIISYQQLKNDVLNNKKSNPTILIHSNNQNIVYLETPFYLKDGHGATSVLQNKKLNRINQNFIVASIDKVIKKKYSYNNKATKIALKNSVITLPTKNNSPDFEFMESFISAIQKLVIKDVILYVDRKIEATKQVVNKK